MSLTKKLHKLKNNPRAFFIDMLAKRKRQLQYFLPRIIRKEKGFATYTVVAACYNVEAYLDKFFTSLVRQTLSFKKNIFCIMVDDGSTDGTATIIKKWQAKYPNNITYLHKENGGQASARNLGMKHVTTPWVTFADPDDFLDPCYFQVIDDFLCQKADQPISMIGTHCIYYLEDKKTTQDTHPLTFKFRQPEHIVPVIMLNKEIQLFVSSALFQVEPIRRYQLIFDDKIKPNFEDAHFIAHYLDRVAYSSVAYLRNAVYFYRKRANKSSSLDKAWQNPKKYIDVLIYGKLDILNKFSQQRYIQNTVLYDLLWHIKYIVNNPEHVAFLTLQQKRHYLQLLDKCFSYIPTETIHSFDLAGCWFYHKVGMLHCFKQLEVNKQIIYTEAYDPYKQEILIRYFTGSEVLEEFFVEEIELIPTHAKTIRHDFLERTFCLERLLWLPLADTVGKLRCRINGKEAHITFAGKQHKEIPISNIPQAFRSTAKIHSPNAPWLIFDRETQADDNAEHLYRWLRHNHPERNSYFVLRKDSHDWQRLEKEGFRLLAYGSPEHEALLHECAKIISSHIDAYVVNYFKDHSTDDKHICWLQHGVTKDDLSRWLKMKKRIDLLVTETPAEQASFVEDGNRYRLTDKEVKLLGFPRHDALLAPHNIQKRQLLIMPTWRCAIAGSLIDGSRRDKNPLFMQTDYAQAWTTVLQSPRLYDMSRKHRFDVVFFPHANIQPYLEDFKIPKYIHVMHHYDGSIQDVFRSSTVMLTDYSSVAFEMAYMHKAVIYYQFDEETIFTGNHIYQKGYFDYRQHGFGPVATDENILMDALEDILVRDGQPSPMYLERMQQTFIFRDGKNCERVYDAICSLDVPNPAGYINTDILTTYTSTAIKQQAWDVAQRRACLLEGLLQNEESRFLRQLCDFRLAVAEGRLLSASEQLKTLKTTPPPCLATELLQGETLLTIYQERYDEALELLTDREDDEALLLKAFCLEKQNRHAQDSDFPDTPFGALAVAYVSQDWHGMLDMASSLKETEASVAVSVLCCHAALKLGDWEQEGHFRTQISRRFGRNFTWRLLAAQRSWHDGRVNAMQDVLKNLNIAFPEGCLAMPAHWLHMYCQSALAEGNWEYLQEANEQLPEEAWLNPTMLPIRKELFCQTGCWQEAAATCRTLLEEGLSNDWLGYATCLRKAAHYAEAYALLKQHEEPENADYWAERAELAEFFGDTAETIHCWQKAAEQDGRLLKRAARHLAQARNTQLSQSLQTALKNGE